MCRLVSCSLIAYTFGGIRLLGGLILQTFLLLTSILLLALNLLSANQIRKQTPRGFLSEIAEHGGVSNGMWQFICGLTGFYLLFVLTVMNHVRILLLPGLAILLDAALWLVLFRRFNPEEESPLLRYFRDGYGMHLSHLLQLMFFSAAIYYLW